jgi:hypothetical protein
VRIKARGLFHDDDDGGGFIGVCGFGRGFRVPFWLNGILSGVFSFLIDDACELALEPL